MFLEISVEIRKNFPLEISVEISRKIRILIISTEISELRNTIISKHTVAIQEEHSYKCKI